MNQICARLAIGLLAGAVLGAGSTRAGGREGLSHPEWKRFFDRYNLHGGCVLQDSSSGVYHWFNKDRCDSGFVPASTFKIVNSCIALESGVVPDVHTVFKWDSVRRTVPAWNHDQDMAEAFTNSTVWYYQEIARRVGRERMRHFLDTVGYGNRDCSGPIDEFWLTGKLRISLHEELDIVRRFYSGNLPFSRHTLDEVRNIFPCEVVGADTLFRKTGWGEMDSLIVGWTVGYLRKDGHVWFLALNVESLHPDTRFPESRNAILKHILADLRLIPAESE